MNKISILLLCAFASVAGLAQKSIKDIKPGNLYKSVDDFKAKKALPEYAVNPLTWKNTLGKESVEISKGGSKDKTKVAELPATFLTEMENGVLMRVFDNELYYVIGEGAVCYYIKKTDADVVELTGPSIYSKQITSGKYIYSRGDGVLDYYSEGITGDIKKLKDSDLEKRLEAKGLKEKYKADEPKREKKDNVSDHITKVKLWTAKYVAML